MITENETTEMWRGVKKDRQSRHAEWKARNMEILRESGIHFRETNGGETLLFRGNGMCVDFFPSTGRWREPKENKTYRGGAKTFLVWYGKKE